MWPARPSMKPLLHGTFGSGESDVFVWGLNGGELFYTTPIARVCSSIWPTYSARFSEASGATFLTPACPVGRRAGAK